MAEKKKLVVVVTNGFNDERSSVAWSVANGGVGMGFEVTMFLVSSGVEWARKGAATNATQIAEHALFARLFYFFAEQDRAHRNGGPVSSCADGAE